MSTSDIKPNRMLAACLRWTAQDVATGRKRAADEIDWLARVAHRDLGMPWTDALRWTELHLDRAIADLAGPAMARGR